MAASDISGRQNRIGVMGGLYNTSFSNNTTLTHCLMPAMIIHPYPHYHRPNLYQIDIPIPNWHPIFSHTISLTVASHLLQPLTHTPIHIRTSFENILMVEISIVKLNCTWFDSINSEIAKASWSARKHSQWNKVNHPQRLVMRKLLSQN